MDAALRLTQPPFRYALNIAQRLAQATVPYQDPLAQCLFRLASSATTPACHAHLNMRLFQVVTHLHPNHSQIRLAAIKALYVAKTCLWGALAPLAIPAILIRWLAVRLEALPFIHVTANQSLPPLIVGDENPLLLLSWNVALLASGHVITDAGVTPTGLVRKNAEGVKCTRVQDVARIIHTLAPHVLCLSEVFETETANDLCNKLSQQRFVEFFHSAGRRALGPPSGLLFASKFPVKTFQFTPFPPEAKTGRAANSGKGFYEATIDIGNGKLVTVIGTHLQHSETSSAPTGPEKKAREAEMNMIAQRVNALQDRCVILTGDLNMGHEEQRSSNWANLFAKDENPDIATKATWIGDDFCVRLARGPDATVSQEMRLDYTFVKDGTGTTTTEIIDVPHDKDTLNPSSVSDHMPVLTTVRPN